MALPLDVIQPSAVRALLSSVVDYAGLFPPAERSMDEAVRRYARHRAGENLWMLGSFVVPVSRLDELSAALDRVGSAGGERSWPLSVLLGDEPEAQVERLEAYREQERGRLTVGAVEIPPLSSGRIAQAAAALPDDVQACFELAVDDQLETRLDEVAKSGVCAKLRTGSTAADRIPSVADVARFIDACRRANVPFKATAGLHHAVRGRHPLTYAEDAECATMHGFLNVAVASVVCAAHGASDQGCAPLLEEVLSESDPRSFVFERRVLAWRDRRMGDEEISRTRRNFYLSFGSCSFAEPVAELAELGLS